ncbi:DoxX family membrane protein [Candidatus Latescibacterota bacterium]
MLNQTKNNFLAVPDYTNLQLSALVILRILIGWHFLYEGFAKVFNENWTSAGFLAESKWIFSPIFNFIVTHPTILRLVDLANMWGLIAIGLGLILGCFARLASLSGAALLLLYYIANPPFIGYKYTAPAEGSYIIVNKNLIELVALLVLTLFPTGIIIGLDRMISAYRKKQ